MLEVACNHQRRHPGSFPRCDRLPDRPDTYLNDIPEWDSMTSVNSKFFWKNPSE